MVEWNHDRQAWHTDIRSEIFCYSYKFRSREVEQYYSTWQAVFEKCKNTDMYIRYRMDLLLLKGFSQPDSNLSEIHRKIMSKYNSLVINILEKIYHEETAFSIVCGYSKKVHEILLMISISEHKTIHYN